MKSKSRLSVGFRVLLSVGILVLASPHAFSSSLSTENKIPVALMASLGDSLTAATFANTTAIESETHKKPTWEAFAVLQDILLGVGANQDAYSWSSGLEVNSHYIQLRSWMREHEPGVGLVVENYSVPGVTSSGLKHQAERVVEAINSGKYAYLKYVTVTIGGNDICTSNKNQTPTKEEDFKNNFKAFFETLAQIKQEQPISIFISSIPNAPHLGRNQFSQVDVGGGYTCAYIRSHVHNSCENLMEFKNEEEFELLKDVVVNQNTVLKALSKEAALTYPQLRTYFSDVFFDYVVTPDMLGYDCFHPNKYGHDLLGKATFIDQPFFK